MLKREKCVIVYRFYNGINLPTMDARGWIRRLRSTTATAQPYLTPPLDRNFRHSSSPPTPHSFLPFLYQPILLFFISYCCLLRT